MTRDLWTCREFPSHKPLWVNQNGKSWHTPPVFSYEWQIKDLREDEFVRVANKGVSAHAHGERVENKIEEGGYPIPGILQSVRKRLISKELEETVVFKCEASMRKEQEAKELEKTEGVQEAAGAASHILIRDAKAAIRRGRGSIYTEEDSRKVHCVSITLLVPFERAVENRREVAAE